MTADANEWWAGIGGQALGPLSLAEVRARWEAGEITASTLVWRAGFPEWRPAGEIAELGGLRPPAASAPVWRPTAGSALAALAGAELAALPGGVRVPAGPSGNDRLDAFTGANGVLARNTASSPVQSAVPPEGDAPAIAAPSPGVADERRRTALTTAAATFAMGAAVAVALVLVFRGGDRDHGSAPAAVAPRTASAVAPASAAAPPVRPQEDTGVLPKPSGEKGAPVVAAAEAPAVAHDAVLGSAPVRASDPPPSATAETPRKPPPAMTPNASAAREPQPRATAHAQARRIVAAPKPAGKPALAPSSGALAAADPPARTTPSKSSSRDPLADLVTDSDLDRELGGSGAPATASAPKPSAGTSSPAPSRSAEAPARKAAEDAVYVPPAPGSDLPQGVTPVQINEAVKARMSSLRSCIDEQRSADPASKGTLKLRWVIAGDGTVKEVRNLSPEYEGKPISRCITGVVRDIRFPTSRTSGQEVVFPFKF